MAPRFVSRRHISKWSLRVLLRSFPQSHGLHFLTYLVDLPEPSSCLSIPWNNCSWKFWFGLFHFRKWHTWRPSEKCYSLDSGMFLNLWVFYPVYVGFFNLRVYSFNSLGHTTVTSLDSSILYSCFLNSGADNTVNRCHPHLGISRWIRICTQSVDPKTPLILEELQKSRMTDTMLSWSWWGPYWTLLHKCFYIFNICIS